MLRIKVTISIVWFIFFIIFFMLGLYHWNISKKNIPYFEIKKRPGADYGSVKVLGADIDQPIKDFINGFNSYLDDQNKSSRKQNKLAAYGYWLASVTALVSLILEWIKTL